LEKKNKNKKNNGKGLHFMGLIERKEQRNLELREILGFWHPDK
jgi:hypothetical protein